MPIIKVTKGQDVAAIPEIHIQFPNGHEDTLILNRHYASDLDRLEGKLRCNFLGHLENDLKACVAVTGCPGQDMEFTINSKHNSVTNMYKLKKSGEVELLFHEAVTRGIEIPLDELRDEDFDDSDSDAAFHDSDDQAELEALEATCASDDTTACKPMQSTNLLNMYVGYDDTFLNSFGSKEEAHAYISDMFTHSQAYFCLESLGTKIDFKVSHFIIYILKALHLESF